MDSLVTRDAAAEAGGGMDPAVAACVQAELGHLGEAREITMRFLRRLDKTAEGFSAEQSVALLAESGQMILNLVRADRALRQIVVMEQEVMGLREPPAPRGGSGGGRGAADGAGGGERLDDLNDLNDLTELDEVKDIHDLLEVEDVGEIEGLDAFYDLAAVETFETFAEFHEHCGDDPANPRGTWADHRETLDQRICEEIERAGAMGPSGSEDVPTEELQRRMKEVDDFVRAGLEADLAKAEAEWRIVREALLRRRAKENAARKRRARRTGRGPP